MRNVATLANFLSRRGFAITIITAEGDAEDREFLSKGVKWISCESPRRMGLIDRSLARYRLAVRLLKLIKQEQPNLLYVIDSWTLTAFLIARLGGGHWHIPFVYHTFDWLEPGLASPVARWIERWAARKAKFVVNTDRSRARMQQTLYRLVKPPVWIPNYLSRRESIPLRRDTVRRSWFAAQESQLKIVIYPSVASEERLTLELIEAFSFLPTSFALVTFGSDDAYAAQCKKSVERLGLQERFRILKPVSYQNLLELVASADLGAIFHDARPSSGYFMANADRLGLFVACGVPFVASDYPNLEAIVYKYQLGICCNPYDSRSIASALIEVWDVINERRTSIRKAFVSSLNYEVHAEQLIDRLESTLNERALR